MTTRPLSPAPRVVGVLLLLVYAAPLAVLVLSPSIAEPRAILYRIQDALVAHRVPLRVALHVEPIANVLVVVPLPLLLTLALWRRVRLGVLGWTGAVFAASCAVELSQAAVLPERTASSTDVVTNTVGGLIGGVVAAAVLGAVRRRRRTRASS